jgi:hypothetical protein
MKKRKCPICRRVYTWSSICDGCFTFFGQVIRMKNVFTLRAKWSQSQITVGIDIMDEITKNLCDEIRKSIDEKIIADLRGMAK